MTTSSCMTRRGLLRGLAGACAMAAAAPLTVRAATLAKVRERGTLTVGLYQDMPPFHVAGRGIDVELAQALADALGVKLGLMPFIADDSVNDDLRNMVWRGHYLGYGPADVLLHVPVERPLMDANPQVTILAPYYRERVAMARRLDRLPSFDAMSQLADQRVAVAGQSLAGWLLIGADGGAYRERLVTQSKDGTECARALQRGEVTLAAGLESELESVLRGDAAYAIEPMPMPRAPRNGWATGLAVRKDAADLAEALQAATAALATSGRLRQIFERHNVGWAPV
ncbi:MAG: transporter substrate-binding domain-containing protein [Proteobacteria bacterium]|nr:transporter substrate-binding domain-containing protein [Pseudomonadota bacterium]